MKIAKIISKKPFGSIISIYLVVMLLYVLNGGWNGADGANFSEWVMIILAFPWIFIYNFILIALIFLNVPTSIFSEFVWGLIAFVLFPAIMNMIVLFAVKKILRRKNSGDLCGE